MRFTHRDLGTYRIGQLTSLIDVVFLLLVFFMVTSSFTTPESQLSSALKSDRATSASAADFQPQVVWVEPDGKGGVMYRIGARVFGDKAALTQVLRELPKQRGVFVRGRDDVPWWGPTAAQQACRDAGFEKVTYVPAG